MSEITEASDSKLLDSLEYWRKKCDKLQDKMVPLVEKLDVFRNDFDEAFDVFRKLRNEAKKRKLI